MYAQGKSNYIGKKGIIKKTDRKDNRICKIRVILRKRKKNIK